MIINQITNSIIKNSKNGDTIHRVAKKTGFAYSAVYKWINKLKEYEVLYLIKKGNKTIIKISKNNIYKKFIELNKTINVVEKDKIFWEIIKKTKLRVRFTENTAIVIWSKGSYVTGDFMDRIYFLEVLKENLREFKKTLEQNKIKYTEKNISKERPLVYLIPISKNFKIEKKENLPIIPLNELITWCKKLYMENILEHLSSVNKLNLKSKYAEINTNL